MTTLSGYINEFFETGCEGVMWKLFQDGKTGYECLVNIDEGDHLKIFGEDNNILFDGIIEQDWNAGWYPYFHIKKKMDEDPTYNPPKDYAHGQPSALGHWIHWTQRGWEPDEWAKLFFHQYLIGNEGKKPLRAELTKKEK